MKKKEIERPKRGEEEEIERPKIGEEKKTYQSNLPEDFNTQGFLNVLISEYFFRIMKWSIMTFWVKVLKTQVN